VPDKLRFATKPQIALEQIRTAQADGIPPGVVLADAGYGVDTAFRDGITALGLAYVVGIQSSASLWPPGQAPLPVKPWSGRGRPPTRVGRSAEHKPVSARDLAAGLPRNAWRRVTWRQGTNAPLASRFAAVRVRPAHRDYKAATPRAEEWCLIEWPVGEAEPTKFWLSTLPANTSRTSLVRHAMLRWRIERDYQEMKQEIGLGHYEGRGWRGFHHHATLCIAAYGFLIAERATIPPSAECHTSLIQTPAIPKTYRPRGAADPA
jgi:SRSO17 transposase